MHCFVQSFLKKYGHFYCLFSEYNIPAYISPFFYYLVATSKSLLFSIIEITMLIHLPSKAF